MNKVQRITFGRGDVLVRTSNRRDSHGVYSMMLSKLPKAFKIGKDVSNDVDCDSLPQFAVLRFENLEGLEVVEKQLIRIKTQMLIDRNPLLRFAG